ncbi:hypothetical protein Tco_1482006 [Tanacetum coccineum]
MVEFGYESRINRFIKSEKRLETYGLKIWKHVVCFNERWSDESSFMEETLFYSTVRFPKKFHPFFLSGEFLVGKDKKDKKKQNQSKTDKEMEKTRQE